MRPSFHPSTSLKENAPEGTRTPANMVPETIALSTELQVQKI